VIGQAESVPKPAGEETAKIIVPSQIAIRQKIWDISFSAVASLLRKPCHEVAVTHSFAMKK